MSNFDTGTAQRSQEFVQRSEMQSQSLRQDSANQMVGGLQQTVEAARQFAMLKAEADARLQMHQQDMAINAVKLQHMQALDATDLMGHQVEAARLQNEAARFEIEQAKKRAQMWDKSDIDEVQAKLMPGMFELGYEPAEGGGFRRIPPERWEELRKRSAARNAPTYTDLRGEWARLLDEGDLEGAAQIKELMDAQKARSGMGMVTPKPKAPPPPTLDPKIEAEMVPRMRALSGIVKDPETQRKIVTAVWGLRAQLAAGMNKGRNKERRPTEFSESEAVDDFIQRLLNPSDPSHKFAWQVIRASNVDVPYVPTPEVK